MASHSTPSSSKVNVQFTPQSVYSYHPHNPSTPSPTAPHPQSQLFTTSSHPRPPHSSTRPHHPAAHPNSLARPQISHLTPQTPSCAAQIPPDTPLISPPTPSTDPRDISIGPVALYTDIPFLTRFVRCIGHAGVTNYDRTKVYEIRAWPFMPSSQSVWILEGCGDITLPILFGKPTRYLPLHIPFQHKDLYDECLEEVALKWQTQTHGGILSNCHSFICDVLNTMHSRLNGDGQPFTFLGLGLQLFWYGIPITKNVKTYPTIFSRIHSDLTKLYMSIVEAGVGLNRSVQCNARRQLNRFENQLTLGNFGHRLVETCVFQYFTPYELYSPTSLGFFQFTDHDDGGEEAGLGGDHGVTFLDPQNRINQDVTLSVDHIPPGAERSCDNMRYSKKKRPILTSNAKSGDNIPNIANSSSLSSISIGDGQENMVTFDGGAHLAHQTLSDRFDVEMVNRDVYREDVTLKRDVATNSMVSDESYNLVQKLLFGLIVGQDEDVTNTTHGVRHPGNNPHTNAANGDEKLPHSSLFPHDASQYQKVPSQLIHQSLQYLYTTQNALNNANHISDHQLAFSQNHHIGPLLHSNFSIDSHNLRSTEHPQQSQHHHNFNNKPASKKSSKSRLLSQYANVYHAIRHAQLQNTSVEEAYHILSTKHRDHALPSQKPAQTHYPMQRQPNLTDNDYFHTAQLLTLETATTARIDIQEHALCARSPDSPLDTSLFSPFAYKQYITTNPTLHHSTIPDHSNPVHILPNQSSSSTKIAKNQAMLPANNFSNPHQTLPMTVTKTYHPKSLIYPPTNDTSHFFSKPHESAHQPLDQPLQHPITYTQQFQRLLTPSKPHFNQLTNKPRGADQLHDNASKPYQKSTRTKFPSTKAIHLIIDTKHAQIEKHNYKSHQTDHFPHPPPDTSSSSFLIALNEGPEGELQTVTPATSPQSTISFTPVSSPFSSLLLSTTTTTTTTTTNVGGHPISPFYNKSTTTGSQISQIERMDGKTVHSNLNLNRKTNKGRNSTSIRRTPSNSPMHRVYLLSPTTTRTTSSRKHPHSTRSLLSTRSIRSTSSEASNSLPIFFLHTPLNTVATRNAAIYDSKMCNSNAAINNKSNPQTLKGDHGVEAPINTIDHFTNTTHNMPQHDSTAPFSTINTLKSADPPKHSHWIAFGHRKVVIARNVERLYHHLIPNSLYNYVQENGNIASTLPALPPSQHQPTANSNIFDIFGATAHKPEIHQQPHAQGYNRTHSTGNRTLEPHHSSSSSTSSHSHHHHQHRNHSQQKNVYIYTMTEWKHVKKTEKKLAATLQGHYRSRLSQMKSSVNKRYIAMQEEQNGVEQQAIQHQTQQQLVSTGKLLTFSAISQFNATLSRDSKSHDNAERHAILNAQTASLFSPVNPSSLRVQMTSMKHTQHPIDRQRGQFNDSIANLTRNTNLQFFSPQSHFASKPTISKHHTKLQPQLDVQSGDSSQLNSTFPQNGAFNALHHQYHIKREHATLLETVTEDVTCSSSSSVTSSSSSSVPTESNSPFSYSSISIDPYSTSVSSRSSTATDSESPSSQHHQARFPSTYPLLEAPPNTYALVESSNEPLNTFQRVKQSRSKSHPKQPPNHHIVSSQPLSHLSLPQNMPTGTLAQHKDRSFHSHSNGPALDSSLHLPHYNPEIPMHYFCLSRVINAICTLTGFHRKSYHSAHLRPSQTHSTPHVTSHPSSTNTNCPSSHDLHNPLNNNQHSQELLNATELPNPPPNFNREQFYKSQRLFYLFQNHDRLDKAAKMHSRGLSLSLNENCCGERHENECDDAHAGGNKGRKAKKPLSICNQVLQELDTRVQLSHYLPSWVYSMIFPWNSNAASPLNAFDDDFDHDEGNSREKDSSLTTRMATNHSHSPRNTNKTDDNSTANSNSNSNHRDSQNNNSSNKNSHNNITKPPTNSRKTVKTGLNGLQQRAIGNPTDELTPAQYMSFYFDIFKYYLILLPLYFITVGINICISSFEFFMLVLMFVVDSIARIILNYHRFIHKVQKVIFWFSGNPSSSQSQTQSQSTTNDDTTTNQLIVPASSSILPIHSRPPPSLTPLIISNNPSLNANNSSSNASATFTPLHNPSLFTPVGIIHHSSAHHAPQHFSFSQSPQMRQNLVLKFISFLYTFITTHLKQLFRLRTDPPPTFSSFHETTLPSMPRHPERPLASSQFPLPPPPPPPPPSHSPSHHPRLSSKHRIKPPKLPDLRKPPRVSSSHRRSHSRRDE